MVSFFDLANKKDNEFYLLRKYSDDSLEQYRQAHIEAFTNLIEINSFNPNEEDLEDRETILMRIAWTGRLDLVMVLVKAGADVNAVSLDGTFALGEAARMGWQEVYDYLLPLTKSDLILKAEKLLSDGLVYRQRRNNKLVEKLVNASKAGNLENVVSCINSRVDVDAVGSEKLNALQSACNSLVKESKEQIVKALLKAEANPNLPEENEQKTTPLDSAVNYRYLGITKLLLKAGADSNKILTEAIIHNNVSTVEFLLKAGAKPSINSSLKLAKKAGNTKIIQLLIEAGAKKN